MNSPGLKWRAAIGRRLGNRWVQLLLALKTEWRFAELYGDFHFGESVDKHAVKNLPQESGKIYGALVKFLADIPTPLQRVLLPGENNAVKPVYAQLLKLNESAILTAGVLKDMDVQWNFEQDPPAVGEFDCIVSQSILEHLIDPYKHVRDCVRLLRPGGWLVIHTMMPGFGYHRYPVDCFRFYPDWFEEISRRLNLDVSDKHIRHSRITYKFRKQP